MEIKSALVESRDGEIKRPVRRAWAPILTPILTMSGALAI